MLLFHARPGARKKRRARRLKAIRPSHAVELQYLSGLAGIVDECKAAGETIVNGLRGHWPSVHDETAPGSEGLIARAAQHLENMVEGRADLLARLAAKRALSGVDEALNKAIQRALGVDISGYLGADTEIGAAVKKAVADNVALIKSIPQEYLAKVSAKVDNYSASGKRWEALAEEVERIGDVTYTRARVIARDQAAKLNSAFNEVRQTTVGITQYVWSTSHDERVRKSHAALDGTTQAWAHPPSVDGEDVNPGEAILCFPGDSEIHFAHDVKKAYRRWYHGELAEIVTGSGKTLSGTPNHPVLTPRGWLALGQLNEGDYVIEVPQEIVEAAERGDNDRVPLISDVFEATSSGGAQVSRRSGHEIDFHGDGADDNVDVVFAARLLVVDHVTAGTQRFRELGFSPTAHARRGIGPANLALLRVPSTAGSVMRCAREILARLWREATHPQQLCFTNAAPFDANLSQSSLYRAAIDAESPGDRQFAFSGHVGVDHGSDVNGHAVVRMAADAPVGLHAPGAQSLRECVLADADDLGGHAERLPFGHQESRVIKARRFDWSGHVFNLETAAGWYVTNGIVTHNCRCVAIPVIPVDEETAPASAAEERQAA